ncbi:hypothetical protein GH714_043646 [Hevea brasiliensis]|uniref:Uncharacterized protein n=1 Tax=Hevea brasiliensis TaxID=3981 RepID=A0A6A6K3Y5_HEVBR|nr:hypothetical protein GH714_043646 [Hevea brasiliensis]
MSKLGDDEVASILNWVYDKEDRKSSSQVCKQWLRVEGQTRLSIRVLEPDLLCNFLPRFPNLLTFESPKLITDAHLDFIAQTCPKLEFLNLNLKQSRSTVNFDGFDESADSDDFGNDGICAIANGCRKLTKVLLRRRKNVDNLGVIDLVHRAQSLTTLDLGRCGLIDDSSLEAIGRMNSIRVLNLEACSLITDRGLEFLAIGSSSRTLKKLVLAECDRVTDFGVTLLQRMHCLEELNLAECGPKLTDYTGFAIASIPSLKRLNVSWLINLSDLALVAIAENCTNLIALDLTGCEMITGAGVSALADHKCLEELVLASCYNISGMRWIVC